MKDLNRKMFIPAIVGFVLLFIGIVFAKVGAIDVVNEYNTTYESYLGLKNEYEVRKSSILAENKLTENRIDELSEIRHKSDDVYFEQFIRSLFDWTSYEDYVATKNSVMSTYHPDENFMNMFFPDVQETVLEDGIVSNTIDEKHIHTTLSDIDTYLISIVGDNYCYFGRIAVTSDSNDKSVTNIMTVMYSVDADGNVSGIKGIL